MRLRTAQFACLLLLLASVGQANATARKTDLLLGTQSISVILMQSAAAIQALSPITEQMDRVAETTPSPLPAATRTIWSMRPPAAQTTRVHAVTGSGI
jgi:hypothetical protein